MTDYLPIYIMMAVPALAVWTVFLLDWFARRKDRQSRNRAA